MGLFNSFKNQLGRDAGRVVSNAVWGDKHASVYRRVKSRNEQLSTEYANEQSFKEKQAKNLDLYRLDAAVIENVDAVINMPISDNKTDIERLINALDIQLSVNKWHNIFSNKGRIRNKYPDAVLKKYKQSVVMANRIGMSEEEICFHSKNLKKYSFWQFIGKFYPLILPLVSLAILLCMLWLGILDDDVFILIITIAGVIAGLALILYLTKKFE